MLKLTADQVLQAIEAKEACQPICWQWLDEVVPFSDETDIYLLRVSHFSLRATVLISSVSQLLTEYSEPQDAIRRVFEVLKQLEKLNEEDLRQNLTMRWAMEDFMWNNCRAIWALIHNDIVHMLDWACTILADQIATQDL